MSNYQYRVDIWHLTCGGGWTAYALTGRKKNVGRIWGIPTLRGQFGQKPKRETWKKQLTKRGRKTGRHCSIKQTNKTKPNNIKHQLLRGGSNWKLIIFVLRCDDFCFPDRKLRIRCMGKYFVSDWALNRKCLNKGYKAAVSKPRDRRVRTKLSKVWNGTGKWERGREWRKETMPLTSGPGNGDESWRPARRWNRCRSQLHAWDEWCCPRPHSLLMREPGRLSPLLSPS